MKTTNIACCGKMNLKIAVFACIRMRVMRDGSVFYVGPRRKWAKLAKEESCLTGVQNFGQQFLYSGSEHDQLYIRCSRKVNAVSF